MALSSHEPRPTAFTAKSSATLCAPVLIKAVVQRVRNGASPRHAIIAAGVSANTCDEWLARGRCTHAKKGAIEPYLSLVSAIDQAEAEWYGDLEARIASDPNWRAKARALSPGEGGAEVP